MISDSIFNSTVENIKNAELAIDVLAAWSDGVTYKHIFGQAESRGSIRSISKPITCLCYGIAIDKGLFADGLDTLIWPYLEKQNITYTANVPYLKKLKLYNLLTLTVGHEIKMLDTKHLATIPGQNYADVVLNTPILHEPGEYFMYSNAPMYLASVVFQNATGIKLVDFAKKHIFEPLGITDATWADSPQGYSMGCTGIEISAAGLLNIGRLFLEGGTFNGERIISQTWVEEMMKPQIETPSMYDEKRVLPKFAYGLNLWVCKDGIRYCDGTDGQYLIIVPAKNMVVITLGHQSNMKPITVCLEGLLK